MRHALQLAGVATAGALLLSAPALADRSDHSARSLQARVLRVPELPRLEYFTYVPQRVAPGSSLLVAVHGVSRNAHEQAQLLAPLCEKTGCVLAAPLFSRKQFPDFQRLGRPGRGARADLALDAMLSELRHDLGLRFERVLLLGYSAGAQFVHRYAMAHPGGLTGAIVGAPGWFTFPSRDQDYPYGLRLERELPGVEFRAEAFLRVPILVVVGAEDDDERSDHLYRSSAVDRQQGKSRLERAERWVAAMHETAAEAGLASRVRLVTLPGAGHSFLECMSRGLGDIVLAELAGPPGRADRANGVGEQPNRVAASQAGGSAAEK